ncbi:MAG: chloride channel protein [Gammaproteobacteria bacterium]|nr:chloride channel protein [Gammaproteobacteria bacterium]
MLRHPHLHRARRQLLSRNKWKLRIIFWSFTIGIGAIAALFSLGGAYADKFYFQLYQSSPLLAYSLTPLGLAFLAWLTRKHFSGTEGSGIPQMIAAMTSREGKISSMVLSLRIAFSKIILTCGGLLCGASIGTIGPTIQVGASIMYSIRQYFPLRDVDMRQLLITAGGAAGISAAFNNPLAGILFAIEELRRNFRGQTSSTLIIAIVLAGLTTLAILGRYSFFGISSASMPASLSVWPAIVLCAIAGGLLGGLFSQSLIFGARKIGPIAQQHPIYVALICGLLLSLIGYLSGGHVYGTGYAESQRLMDGGELSTAYPLLKLLATVVSYLSGIPGGIFTPSLSIGAGLGAELGQIFTNIPQQTLLLLGMVSYFTGVVQTPLTAFVIVMEMTNSSSMVLPLMAAALIAKGASHLVCPRPIYQILAEAYLARLAPAKS